MKCLKWLNLFFVACWLVPVSAQTNSVIVSSTNAPSITEKMAGSQKQLIKKYDSNHNGKIDVQERKNFVNERARLVQEFAREEAKSRTNSLVGGTNQWNHSFPFGSRQEILEKYDSDKDGRLDRNEMKAFHEDRIKEYQKMRNKTSTNTETRSQSFPSKKSQDLNQQKPLDPTNENTAE